MITDRSVRTVVGVDTGGTFTDFVACASDGTIQEAKKVSTTPEDPSEAILAAVGMLAGEQIGAFLHGTTTGTNALLERRGARTALLTTKGFRDVLELGRQARPSLYDWYLAKPEPLVPRELSFELDERMSLGGRPRRDLDEDGARRTIATLRDLGVESVAVSLLHAYADDGHETRVGQLLTEELPEAHVSLSSVVLPEIMEYERTSTTVANAYLGPVIERYVERLLAGLRARGLTAPVFVMQSSGGLGSAQTIGRRAVETVLSGPAAGVIGGLASTVGSSKSEFLTIDMGGTSFDIAYAEGREPAVSRESVVDGMPLAVPALDIHTLGAGGGSIAWIDRGGSLRVGPASAGAEPGPACYARGGDEPTVTDANLLLGRLGEKLLGGDLELDADAAERVFERKLARPLGVSVLEAARGVVEVVNAAMAKGMHLMSVARGRDPRRLGIVGFGGAGPLHACDLAAALGSDEVIIPVLPGNTSAVGLALADVRQERSSVVLAPLESLGADAARRTLDELAGGVVQGLVDDGVDTEEVTLHAFARVSYEGQRYQLQLPLNGGEWKPPASFSGSLDSLPSAFNGRHLAAYGYTRSEPLSLFSLDVVGSAPVTSAQTSSAELSNGDGRPSTWRKLWLSGEFAEVPVYARQSLCPGRRLEGPAVVEQSDTTTVVPPAWSGQTDRFGNLILERRA